MSWFERADPVGQVCGFLRQAQDKLARTGLPSFSPAFALHGWKPSPDPRSRPKELVIFAERV